MSREQFTRTERLLGGEAMDKLAASRVAVFGVGGVGGYVVEALARSGIGTLDLIDNDVVCESNLNRQIIALHSTLGQYKVDVAARRAKEIPCRIMTGMLTPKSPSRCRSVRSIRICFGLA